MKWIFRKVAGIGDWLVGLSDRARLQLVVVALLLLGGGGIYKLIVSIDKLDDPLPVATPEQLIKPMEQLMEQTSDNVSNYQRSRQRETSRLDSLAKVYSDKNLSPQ